jgi:hypothetical protein
MDISPARPSGAAASAFLSTSLGLVALAISHVISQASNTAKEFVHGIGKLWMPGAQGIGPYSGKETIALAVWLISWIVLHFALRKREVSVRWVGVVWLFGLGLATTLLWPPVTHWIIGK